MARRRRRSPRRRRGGRRRGCVSRRRAPDFLHADERRATWPATHAEPPPIVHFGHRLLSNCRAPLRRRSRPPHAAARAAIITEGLAAPTAHVVARFFLLDDGLTTGTTLPLVPPERLVGGVRSGYAIAGMLLLQASRANFHGTDAALRRRTRQVDELVAPVRAPAGRSLRRRDLRGAHEPPRLVAILGRQEPVDNVVRATARALALLRPRGAEHGERQWFGTRRVDTRQARAGNFFRHRPDASCSALSYKRCRRRAGEDRGQGSSPVSARCIPRSSRRPVERPSKLDTS